MSAARVGMSAAMQGRSSPALGALVAVLTACSGSTVASSSPPTTSPTPSSVTTNAPTPPIPPEPMVQQMIAQAVLDHPRVAAYLTAAPPWTLSAGRGLELGASALRIGGAPVVVVASPADARVVLVARERLADAERVRFEIPGEGIRGHADVQLIDWIWTVRDVVVVER
jgi:hypothetical protein